MKKYPDFYSVLVGNGGAGFFFGFTVFALFCALIMVLIDFSRRDPSSPRSPDKPSLRFWLADNLVRFIANFLLIPVAVRLCYEYVPPVQMLLLSAGISFGVDGLGMLAKRLGILTTRKLASKVTENLKNKEEGV